MSPLLKTIRQRSLWHARIFPKNHWSSRARMLLLIWICSSTFMKLRNSIAKQFQDQHGKMTPRVEHFRCTFCLIKGARKDASNDLSGFCIILQKFLQYLRLAMSLLTWKWEFYFLFALTVKKKKLFVRKKKPSLKYFDSVIILSICLSTIWEWRQLINSSSAFSLVSSEKQYVRSKSRPTFKKNLGFLLEYS